jgi:hypothetical protein
VSATEEGADRIRVSGITGLPPPPTTRVGVTAHGGYQAEWHFYLVGLDMEEKIQWMEEQARYAIGEELISRFSCLKFHLMGYHGGDGGTDEGLSQDRCTADFRIFAQAKEKELFSGTDPESFARKLYETVLQSCPVSIHISCLNNSKIWNHKEQYLTDMTKGCFKTE